MRLFFVLTFALLLLGCSNSEGVSSSGNFVVDTVKDSRTGMVRVNAKNAIVVLGTTDASAKTSERPQMKVNVDYPFSIGRHEVTCGEFNTLMTSATGLTLTCDDDNLPATNLTYYDAVLFANELSKEEGSDTCFTYTTAVFDGERHCTNLEGFVYHPEVDGYRLPTEAEWVLVASQRWNESGAWTSENSDYRLHKGCSNSDSDEYVCDMKGNAMEWVNDWLGNFRDTTLLNYVGAPDGGALGQRIVKGGSYRNSAESIRLYNRGDVYTVTSSTRAEYVGFRLAYGAIPDATWMGSDGRANASRVVPLASSAAIRSAIGTYKVKFAFRNDNSRNLSYIDYSSGIVSVTEIADTLDVYHPEISPDGKRVAFCTGLEGVSGKSALYVRNLNALGSGLVKLDVESAAVPRWRVLENGDTVVVYVTDAGNNKDEAVFRATSTWQVQFANGKFGTPQKLFDGAYHGGVSGDNSLSVTGARLLRARIAVAGSTVMSDAHDTVWYNGEQACNVSLSKDGSKRTLFLDFGGKTGREFVGESYGTHERLLVVDSIGRLVQSVAAPSGFSFDHSEWAIGGENLVVASLTNANGAHKKIVLINLLDSNLVELAEGDELWHPNLWVAESIHGTEESLLNLDSAGVYYVENVWYNALELRVKMENFWYRRNEVTVVGLGSSRMMFGVYEKNILSENFLNMAYSAGDMRGMHYLLKNYILPHIPHLKTIVVEMSPDLLWYDRSTSWGPIIDGVPGFKYDEDHSFWVDDVPEAFLKAVSNCPKPQAALQHPYNLVDFQLPTMGWYSSDVFRDTTALTLQDLNYQYDYSLFEDIVRMAHEHHLNVICFVAPQNPDYRNTGSYGVYGPKRSIAESILKQVQEMDVIWMDENKMGNHDYTANMAYNMDHLSAAGAAQLTSRLDSLLETLK